MAKHGQNEGMLNIGDFVDEAIRPADVPQATVTGGHNAPMRNIGDFVLDLSSTPAFRDSAANAQRLRSAFGALPVPDRSIIILRLDGKSFAEIAGTVGLPEESVKSRFADLCHGLHELLT